MTRSATPAEVISGDARWCVAEGDALEVVRSLPAARVDAVVTDPPAGIAFMGAVWDRDRGGRRQWVAWLADVLRYARTATRDGGRALVWSLPRTSHWTGCAIEDAGWAVENTVTHLFGTGWPKSKGQLKPLAETWWLARKGRSTALNIDGCRVGARKCVPGSLNVGTRLHEYFGGPPRSGPAEHHDGTNPNVGRYPPNAIFSHAPGCHCVGEKPVPSDSTNASRGVMGHGGSLRAQHGNTGHTGHADPDGTELIEAWECAKGCPVADLDRQSGNRPSGAMAAGTPRMNLASYSGGFNSSHGTPHDIEASTGGASRFFPTLPGDPAVYRYQSKPTRRERSAGVDLDARPADAYATHRHRRMQGPAVRFDGAAVGHSANDHPTVKSVALMRWLVRLVTRPGDIVLDPFGGSGTTGVAALCEGRRVILVEREPRFAEIARQRLEHVTLDLGRPVRGAPSARTPSPSASQLSFDSLATCRADASEVCDAPTDGGAA